MSSGPPHVSLGFTAERFPAGLHVCQVFSEDAERDEVLRVFLRAGLQTGERCCCYSDHTCAETLVGYFGEQGLQTDSLTGSGALILSPARDVYFAEDRFDPERMLAALARFYDESIHQGYAATRVIGEMAAEVQHISGGTRLLEYESRISLLLRERPITAVCQYDSRGFEGAAIMDILKVHPLMIVRGAIVRNPFYIAPEQFLAR